MNNKNQSSQDHLSSGLVRSILKSQTSGPTASENEEPFFVCDLDYVRRQFEEWTYSMPDVKPFYAVKCNPDVVMIKQIAGLGGGFDCASKAEIELVLQQGVEPEQIILAHPCKSESCLAFARDNNVTYMTFDNAAELEKVSRCFPRAQLLLRILADDPTAICRLGEKFGASLKESKSLLKLAKLLGLNVAGISFHVGSGANDPESFNMAIRDALEVWTYATELGLRLHTLDIGGGFSQQTLSTMAPVIQHALKTYFATSGVRVIAEPGRYFAEGAFTLGCQVVAKRDSRSANAAESKPWGTLYLNDGIYGDFSGVIFEHATPVPHILRAGDEYFPALNTIGLGAREQSYTIFGPTCDSLDCIRRGCVLPRSIEIGDWLYFPNMGAYSIACSTTFNGFSNKRKIIYVSTAQGCCIMGHEDEVFD